MNHLLPHPIPAMVARGQNYTTFEAVTLFLDFSGYTSLAEAIMRQGKHGAEELAGIVNDTFGPVITAIYAHGGYISGFAGDAFTAIFPVTPSALPETQAHHACAAAWHIRHLFENRTVHTQAGEYPLAVKIGLALGLVECGILGDASHRAYYYRGPAIDACGQAEHFCQKGDIVLSDPLQALVRTDVEPVEISFCRLVNYPDSPLPPAVFPTYPPEALTAFFNASLLETSHTGEFRHVACVFVSFREFSRPELEAFAQDLLREVDKREGYVTNFDAGDKGANSLILFGAPITHENDLARGLQVALYLREKYGENVRCGITVGQVYFGRLGIPERCEIANLGNATNFAARLMMRATWGQILVPGRVAQNPGFAFTRLGEFPYKGFSAPILTYQLDREKASSEQFFVGPMVGRDRELNLLVEDAARIGNGETRAAVLYGEAGVGKSRLTFAVRQALGARVMWLTGQTDPILHQALNPFVYLLREYFEQNPDTPEENVARFERRFQQLFALPLPDPLRGELLRTQSFLGALLNLHWPTSLYAQLQDAKLRYENTLSALRAFLLALTCSRPVVLELEDGHWFDEATREFLARLTRQGERYPLWVLITSRYADDGSCPPFPLGVWPVLHLELGHLPSEDLRRLATLQFAGEVHDDLLALLEERTQGIPFFIQQFAWYLTESRAVEQRAGQWYLKNEISGLPESLTALLISRLDRLPSAVKHVVQIASVLGREFDTRLLATMLDTDISAAIENAEQAQIWSAVNEVRYIFKHALLRDAAYDMLLRVRLRELHQMVVLAYEKLYTGDLSPYLDELAYHAEHSGRADKQRQYFLAAGDAAKASYRNAAALRHYERLLPLLPDPTTQIDLYLKYGAVLELIGKWQDAEKSYQTALGLAEQNQDASALAQCQQSVAHLFRQRGDYETALKGFERAKTEWEAVGDPRGLSQVLTDMGVLWFRIGNYEASQRSLEQGLALARTHNYPIQISNALSTLGSIAHEKGDYALAQNYYEECLAYKTQQGDPRGIAAAFNNLGLVASRRDQQELAIEFHEKSLTIKREVGDKWGIAGSLNNLGQTLFFLENYALSQQAFQESLTICKDLGDKWGTTLVLNNLGDVARLLGDHPLALEYYTEALALCRSTNNKRGESLLLNNKGHVMFAFGNFVEARSCYVEAFALAQSIQHPFEIATSLLGLANIVFTLDRTNAQYAAHLLSAAHKFMEINHAPLSKFEQELYDQLVENVRNHLQADFSPAWEEGRRLNPADILSHIITG
ncbi:MAG TPA: tetratricopeptide repeat protein [Anaerolineales bacterium]|nr:tetratricopeptide repeat protein [Anaerolineales bacterium]